MHKRRVIWKIVCIAQYVGFHELFSITREAVLTISPLAPEVEQKDTNCVVYERYQESVGLNWKKNLKCLKSILSLLKTSRNRRQAIFLLQNFLLRGYGHFLSGLNCFCSKSCWANHFTVCRSMDATKHFKHQQVNTFRNFFSNTCSIIPFVESWLRVCLIYKLTEEKNRSHNNLDD